MLREKYISKKNRDRRFKELKAQGKRVFKSTINNQQLHPQYINDFEGEEKNQTGFGNVVYKTFFPKLYLIEEEL